MTTGVLATSPILQFTLNNGELAIGGSIRTQIGGVDAPTYADAALTIPLPNPIPLNSRGEVSDANGNSRQLFMVPNQIYTWTLSDVLGNQIWSASYVNGIQVTGSSIAPSLQTVTDQAILASLARTPAEITAGVIPTNYAYPPGDVRRYGADPTGVADSTIAINAALQSSLYVVLPIGTFLISSSLIYQNNSYITGSGYLNTTIKGDLSNASFFRSSFGEIPAVGNRPLGITITNLCIFPKTPATITSGSVGINFRNAQYCSAVGLLMQYTDIGMVTDQNGQFLRFERVHAQLHNTAFWSNATIGGNNCISDCSLGGNNVALDIDGGAWDISKTDCSAILASTTYCVHLGRPGGASTVVHADKLYIEGLSSSTITMQIENSVNRSRVSMHRHSILGTIVNNAAEACMIEVPGQGFYNPVYLTQRVGFSSTIDGSELGSLRATAGNQLEVRNAVNSGSGDILTRNIYANGAANNPGAAGILVLGSGTAGTATAGGAPGLPATPQGYLIAYVGTSQVKIPFYNV